MKNSNIQTGQETHCGFHDRIQSVSHEGGHRQFTCYILIEKECMGRHYQNHIGIPTNGST